MAILSDFDIFAQILNSSGMPQSEDYASKSAGYCLYTMLCVYNITYMPMDPPQAKKVWKSDKSWRKFENLKIFENL